MALANLMEQGEFDRHIRKTRRIYAARRDVLAHELTAHLNDALQFDIPAGGLALWVRLRPQFSAKIWADRARRLGVDLHPWTQGPDATCAHNAFRLGFAHLEEAELKRLVALLVASRPPA